MNNHEPIDYGSGNEFTPPEDEIIKIGDDIVWHVEKENQENHNGI